MARKANAANFAAKVPLAERERTPDTASNEVPLMPVQGKVNLAGPCGDKTRQAEPAVDWTAARFELSFNRLGTRLFDQPWSELPRSEARIAFHATRCPLPPTRTYLPDSRSAPRPAATADLVATGPGSSKDYPRTVS